LSSDRRILQHACQSHAPERTGQTEKVVAENVRQHESQLPMLEIHHALKCVTGKRGEGTAETHDDQHAPARIDDNALRGPDHEKPNDKASNNVDNERAVRKNRAKLFYREAANPVAKICTQNGRYRDGKKIFHDGTPTKQEWICL